MIIISHTQSALSAISELEADSSLSIADEVIVLLNMHAPSVFSMSYQPYSSLAVGTATTGNSGKTDGSVFTGNKLKTFCSSVEDTEYDIET